PSLLLSRDRGRLKEHSHPSRSASLERHKRNSAANPLARSFSYDRTGRLRTQHHLNRSPWFHRAFGPRLPFAARLVRDHGPNAPLSPGFMDKTLLIPFHRRRVSDDRLSGLEGSDKKADSPAACSSRQHQPNGDPALRSRLRASIHLLVLAFAIAGICAWFQVSPPNIAPLWRGWGRHLRHPIRLRRESGGFSTSAVANT